MNSNAIVTIFDYNYDAHDRVWEQVMELTEEQFVHEVDYSWRSVRNHLVHVMSTDNRWLARLQGHPLPERLEFIDFPNQDAVREKWNEIVGRVQAYAKSVSDAELQEIVMVDLPPRGGMYRNARWEIMAHIVNHGTDHRAQILNLLHQLGAMTIEQDLILHLWEEQR